jgi:hypothetical protein
VVATLGVHERALVLAASQLDFPLMYAEVIELNDHMSTCSDCAQVQKLMFEDKDNIVSNSDDEAAGAPVMPGSDADEDDEEKQATSVALTEESDADEDTTFSENGEDEFSVDASNPDDDDDDDRGEQSFSYDDEEHDSLSGNASGTPDNASNDRPSPTEDDSQTRSEDDDADTDDDPDDASESSESRSDGDDEDDSDDEPDFDPSSMTDEELGGQDSPASEMPECVADAVEDTAAENGAIHGDKVDKEASELVRRAADMDDDGLGGKIDVCRSTRGLTNNNPRSTRLQVSDAATAAIRNAFMRSRSGHTGVEAHQSRGRLDSKGIHRVVMSDVRLFKRRHAPDPGKFLVWVMVDVSGSMDGTPIMDAAAVSRALADAIGNVSNVRAAIWAWSSPFRRENNYMASAGAAKVWESGQPTDQVYDMMKLRMGGTPDSSVMSWAWRSILKELQTDETPVILMCSDGQGYGNLTEKIDAARRHGVIVKSVAIGYEMRIETQVATYGTNNYIEWQGSLLATARPLATMLGKIAGGNQ